MLQRRYQSRETGRGMRVTFCAYDRPNYIGGPNAGLRRLLPALRAQGVDAECLFLVFGEHSELTTVRSLEQSGVPCRYTRYHRWTEERVRWILSMLRDDPPDIFVPNLMPAAYFASRWVRKAGIPTVGVLRNVDAFHEGFLEEFAQGAPEFRQTAFVGVSEAAVEMIRQTRVRFEAVCKIPSPVFVPGSPVRYYGGPFRVMFSGRLVEHPKRVGMIAKAFCNAARKIGKVEFNIYGAGKDRKSVETVLESEGAGLPVRLRGRVDSDRMPLEIMQHHVIVLMSEYEGLPLGLMEGNGGGARPRMSARSGRNPRTC